MTSGNGSLLDAIFRPMSHDPFCYLAGFLVSRIRPACQLDGGSGADVERLNSDVAL